MDSINARIVMISRLLTLAQLLSLFDGISVKNFCQSNDNNWAISRIFRIKFLGRQIGQISSGAFGLFSAKLSAPILVQ